jgi:hypothetical protein
VTPLAALQYHDTGDAVVDPVKHLDVNGIEAIPPVLAAVPCNDVAPEKVER